MTTRRQATMYLPQPQAAAVEALRAAFNPVQHTLIRAHVTLCREDEVQDWDEIATRLVAARPISVPLAFGAPVRDDNLVFLPAVGDISAFDQLREHLLAGSAVPVRRHAPHITLIHPRNGVCTDDVFARIVARTVPFEVTLTTVTLIEQRDGAAWRDLSRT